MTATQTPIEATADNFAAAGTAASLTSRRCRLKINRWNTSAFSAATPNSPIFSKKVGSTPSALALVMNSNMPDGMIRNNPLADHGNKWPDNSDSDILLEMPNSRKSNMNAGPTRITMPTICTISKAGYNHSDWRIPSAHDVFSSQSRKSVIGVVSNYRNSYFSPSMNMRSARISVFFVLWG